MYELKKKENGFEYIEISNAKADAKIALQGAHIYEYKHQGEQDILWLSPTSQLEKGMAIRGGIPICWPRFGVLDKSMPAHGFSRTTEFSLLSIKEIDEETTEVTLTLEDNKETRKIWDFSFRLEVIFTISDTLSVETKTTNRDSKEFMITQALHTYFDISSIHNIKIGGFENCPYLDTLTNKKELQGGTITISSECDRVYQEVHKDIVLKDKEREILISAQGSSSCVVWNPWIEKGSRMSGMKPDAYKEFVCIESANAYDDAVLIKAGESHTLKVTLSR
ncbi:MAG: D-hexose-6-phosphate mutarotase [Campylobacterota bacterium]|nr:D-hexose-6-phosphate mutarotase [Campylobacterota bacterium]